MSKGLRIILVFLVLVLLGVMGFGYFYISKPDVIFTTLLNKVSGAKEEFKQVKMNLNMKFNVDIGDEYKDYTDIINKLSVNTNLHYDSTNETFLLGLGAGYNEKVLADASIYYENEVAYIELKDLFDKLIKLDLSMEDDDELDISNSDLEVLLLSVEEALKETIKVADYVTAKEEVDGKKLNKSTLIINNENKDKLVNTFIDCLNDNDEFISTVSKLSDMTKEEVKEELNYAKEVDDLENEIKVSVYTKPIVNKMIKLSIVLADEEILSFVQEDNNNFVFEINYDEIKMIMNIKEEGNNKFNIVYSINGEGVNISLTLVCSYQYDEKIAKPNLQNFVAIEDLEEEDTTNIMNNLMENDTVIELMEVIETLMSEENSDTGLEEPSFDY